MERALSASTALPSWTFSVLQFLPLRERCAFTTLSRAHANLLQDEYFWKFQCALLSKHAKLYVPDDLCSIQSVHSVIAHAESAGWKELFFDLWERRTMWDLLPPPEATAAVDLDAPLPVATKQRFSIGVCARFRPSVTGAGGQESTSDEVILPLYQRLELIMGEKKCSKAEAMKLVMAERWGKKADQEDAWGNCDCVAPAKGESGAQGAVAAAGVAEADDADVDGPARPKHAGANMRCAILSVQPQQRKVLTVAPGVGLREFAFNTVFDQDCLQTDVYRPARKLVADVINGFNATILVYGQTGSGKTHTMFGGMDHDAEAAAAEVAETEEAAMPAAPPAPPAAAAAAAEAPDGAQAAAPPGAGQGRLSGIVPRACAELLAAMAVRKQQLGIESELKCTYVEVFGDEVNDLLQGGQAVSVNKAAAQRFVAEGRAARRVQSVQDVALLLREGDSQKRVAATAMNERSSRAHTLFILSLVQTDAHCADGAGARHQSSLYLADLGGSEQIKRSKADAGISKTAGHGEGDEGARKYKVVTVTTQEGITRSTRVFDFEGTQQAQEQAQAEDEAAGGDGTKAPSGANWEEYYRQRQHLQEAQNINQGLFALKKCIDALNQQQDAPTRKVFVPYADSRLTLLLAAGLGGNSKTMVIVCGSRENQNAAETLQALRFGERCSQVQNTASGSAAALARALAELAAKIEQCEAEIKEKEKWVERKISRPDPDAPGGIETVTTTVLAGAEKERLQLVHLVRQRKQLLGEDLDDGEGATEWADRITTDVVNVTRDATSYNIKALEGDTMQM
jgi:hypothetical protein